MADKEITKFDPSSLLDIIYKDGVVPVAVPRKVGQAANNYKVPASDFYKHWEPHVASNGDITWTLESGETPPAPQNIKGPQGEQGPQGKTGPSGVSPTVSVSPIAATQDHPAGVRVTITDAAHPTGQSFDVYNGDTEIAAIKMQGASQALEPDSSKVVTIPIDDVLSSTSENPVQNKAIYAAIGDVETLLAAL